MFGFMRKPGARAPSTAMRRAIEADGLPRGVDRPSALAVVEQRGQHDGRSVKYIRIFEPAWAQALGVDVRTFDDLDAHQALILKSGYIEPGGGVVITARASDSEAGASVFSIDDRVGHAGDAHLLPAPDRNDD